MLTLLPSCSSILFSHVYWCVKIFAQAFSLINISVPCYGLVCSINSVFTLIFCGAVVGAMAGYVGFVMIYWGYRLIFRREGMGYGDVKYLSALGAWHGWCVLPELALVAALLALLYLLMTSLFNPARRTLKPTAFWAISGGSGFMCRLADAG